MTYFVNTSSAAPCENCGATQDDRPMVFRGENWCSERCRRIVVGEDQ